MNDEVQIRLMTFFEKVMGDQLPIGLKAAYISAWITTIVVLVVCGSVIYFALRYIKPLWHLSRFMDHSREASDIAERVCDSNNTNDPYIIKGRDLLQKIAGDSDLEMRVGVSGFVGVLISVILILGCTIGIIQALIDLPTLFFYDGWALNYFSGLLKVK